MAGDSAALAYGELFCERAAEEPKARWDIKDNDLWSEVVAPNFQKRAFGEKSGKPPSKVQRVAMSTCWEFNNGLCSRDQCRFDHACERCGGPHSWTVFGLSPLFAVFEKQDWGVEPRCQGRLWSLYLRSLASQGYLPKMRFFSALAPTPVHLSAMLPLLQAYPNRTAANYLEAGFQYGFHIPVSSSPVSRTPPNQKSMERFCELASEAAQTSDAFPDNLWEIGSEK
ncbi:uncharacterized protein LOC128406416 [Podarcis raffonei]|uniref:uncharacterized protein LOC128406416 n=1 Tax=Podarcis raffonei TaxID=65483 RepID=UPI0023297DC0|nr:uncharacterized protein LOC128406416 [Podarcis raffonei]